MHAETQTEVCSAGGLVSTLPILLTGHLTLIGVVLRWTLKQKRNLNNLGLLMPHFLKQECNCNFFLHIFLSSYIYIQDFYCHEIGLLQKSGMLEISKWYWSSVSALFDLGLLRHWKGPLSPLPAKSLLLSWRHWVCLSWKNMNEIKDNYLQVHKMYILDLNRTRLLSCTKLGMLWNL